VLLFAVFVGGDWEGRSEIGKGGLRLGREVWMMDID